MATLRDTKVIIDAIDVDVNGVRKMIHPEKRGENCIKNSPLWLCYYYYFYYYYYYYYDSSQ